MKTKHTPGPWVVVGEPNQYLVGSPCHEETGNRRIVCRVSGQLSVQSEEANARLIAAAPSMLEALRVIAEWDPAASPSEPGGMSIMDAIDIAQAAIRKAEEGDPR